MRDVPLLSSLKILTRLSTSSFQKFHIKHANPRQIRKDLASIVGVIWAARVAQRVRERTDEQG
jgi:hypothetical protein